MSITTGKVRASYAHLFQPHAMPGSTDAKYQVTLLIPKSDTATLNTIYTEMERAKQAGLQKVFGGAMPPVINYPVYDGDGARPNGEPFGEECKGHMVLRASSREKPAVVDIHVQPILNPAEMYSGCYIRASIDFFAYSQSGNRGIGCGLNAVQKVSDGEALTSRVTAEEAFGGNNAYVSPVSISGFHTPQGYTVPASPGLMPAYSVTAGIQPSIDPITGQPVMPGGVMGI